MHRPPPALDAVSLLLQSVLAVADDFAAILACCLKCSLAAAVVQMLATAAVHRLLDARLGVMVQAMALLAFIPPVLLGMRARRMGDGRWGGCGVLAVFSPRGARMAFDLLCMFLLALLAGGLVHALLARFGVRMELAPYAVAAASLFLAFPGQMANALVIGVHGPRIGRVSLGVRLHAAAAAATLSVPAIAVQKALAEAASQAMPVVEAAIRLGSLVSACLCCALLYGLLLALAQASRDKNA